MRRAPAVLALALAAGCVGPPEHRRALEAPLVFRPQPYPAGDWSPAPAVEDAWFDAPDGTRLHGWFAAADRPRAVVLFAHGNSGNVSGLRDVLHLFVGLDASVLAFDYRGYGRSGGVPTEAGVLADARAARRWLAGRCGVAEADVVLVGHSLGGGVAVGLAARDGARGLVLAGTFTSLPDVVTAHFPLLPVHTLMRTRLDSLSKVRDYHGPLLQAHGDADRVVPYALGRKLFEAANEPKRFVTVAGAGHEDVFDRPFVAAIDEFLGSLPARGAPPDAGVGR